MPVNTSATFYRLIYNIPRSPHHHHNRDASVQTDAKLSDPEQEQYIPHDGPIPPCKLLQVVALRYSLSHTRTLEHRSVRPICFGFLLAHCEYCVKKDAANETESKYFR